MLQMTKDKVMGGYYIVKNVVRRWMKEVAKSVFTRFLGNVICIRRAIPKWCTGEISELKHFAKHLCRNWTRLQD